jgi:hypothetical protein
VPEDQQPHNANSHNREPGGPSPHEAHDGGGEHPGLTPDLTTNDLSALADYTGNGFRDLNDALRRDALDASQLARVEAINNALDKLPPYEGPVVRGTNLPEEVLDRYQPGQVITEDAFLSTTTNVAVARSPAFDGNVEFIIMSSTGRDVSPFSLVPHEQEVLFRSGTSFYVVSKVVDSLTGKTIIRMIERQ